MDEWAYAIGFASPSFLKALIFLSRKCMGCGTCL
jgi:hypothetical protein